MRIGWHLGALCVGAQPFVAAQPSGVWCVNQQSLARTAHRWEPLLAHPRVLQATVKAVCNALIGMSNQTQGLDALLAADLPGFVASTDARYASVRKAYRNL